MSCMFGGGENSELGSKDFKNSSYAKYCTWDGVMTTPGTRLAGNNGKQERETDE